MSPDIPEGTIEFRWEIDGKGRVVIWRITHTDTAAVRGKIRSKSLDDLPPGYAEKIRKHGGTSGSFRGKLEE